jgi:hypothetical protein
MAHPTGESKNGVLRLDLAPAIEADLNAYFFDGVSSTLGQYAIDRIIGGIIQPLGFLRETVPRNWADLCDSVTDNFRVINPKDFRVMT